MCDDAGEMILHDRPWSQWYVSALCVGLIPLSWIFGRLGLTDLSNWHSWIGLGLFVLVAVYFAVTPVTTILLDAGRQSLIIIHYRLGTVTRRSVRLADVASIEATDVNDDLADKPWWRRVVSGTSEGPSIEPRLILKSRAIVPLTGRCFYSSHARRVVKTVRLSLERVGVAVPSRT